MTEPRKKRAVHQGIVDTDDVTCEPGIGFIKWIPIARKKLRERENILLSKRWSSTLEVTQQSMNGFIFMCNQKFQNDETVQVNRMQRVNQQNYQQHLLNNQSVKNIKAECMAEITKELVEWDGVEKHEKKIVDFRGYWKIAKNSFDQKKLKIITKYFWIPSIYQIKKFADKAAFQFFSNRFPDLQKKYGAYLNQLILRGMCHKKLKIPNTRPMVVIAKRIFLLFAQTKDPVLQTLFVLSSTRTPDNYPPNTNSGNLMRDSLIEQLSAKCEMDKNRFVVALQELHTETNNNFVQQQQQQQEGYYPYAGIHGISRCIHCHLQMYRYRPY